MGLADQMLKTRYVQTAAMKHGIETEPKAAEFYANLFGVNAYKCSLLIHPQCFFLGCSPDRCMTQTVQCHGDLWKSSAQQRLLWLTVII